MTKIPKILKISKKEFPVLGCFFSTGESRTIDISDLFKKIGIIEGDFGYELLIDKSLFNSVELEDYILTWNALTKEISLPSGKKVTANFQLDPVVVYEYSVLDKEEDFLHQMGAKLKELRKQQHLTLDELASLIGTNKQYLSRIERSKSDIELKTLTKIFEVGLNKKIFISHYDVNDPIKSYSNAFFSASFKHWMKSNVDRIDLIEGINEDIKLFLIKNKWNSVSKLADVNYEVLRNAFQKLNQPLEKFMFIETWPVQAKFMVNEDWISLIRLQQILKEDTGAEPRSKVEVIAEKELNESVLDLT